MGDRLQPAREQARAPATQGSRMHPLPGEIEAYIRAGALWRPHAGWLVAVSGGLDSMVLLDVLQRVAPVFRGRLVVAHFDHGLRGRASTADRRWVEQAAARRGLEFEVGTGDVRGLAQSEGLSIEMAARRLRHAFLAGAARRHRLSTIALGHHQDDQLELFWVRLLRGASPGGLAGMRPVSVSPVDSSRRLLRPLLEQPRARLLEYARSVGLRWREDRTNRQPDILRNRIRAQLLPELQRRYQPALRQVVLRLMDMLRADDEVLEQACSALADASATGTETATAGVPRALQRRWISRQLTALGVAPAFDLIEGLRSAVGAPVMAPGGRRLFRDAAGRVRDSESAVKGFCDREQPLDLRGPRRSAEFGGLALRWGWRAVRGSPPLLRSGPGGEECFDAATVGRHITLRHWRAGDRFQPIGFSRAVKLQDYFTNRKVPSGERRRRVVAVDAQSRIFWVQGERISELHKLGPETRTVLRWRSQPSGPAQDL